MFAEHSADYIRSPVFAMQSQYDSWQTGNVQGKASTQVLGNNITARIQSDLMSHNKDSGAFLGNSIILLDSEMVDLVCCG